MKLAAALVLTLSALAQDLPEIRGTVTEYASTNPVSGATITLFEFVAPEGTVIRQQVATAFTNDQGVFSIKPAHAGRYYLEASKTLYLTADEIEKLGSMTSRAMMETPLDIPEEASGNIRFTLVRPGGITGRIIDENDKPVPNFTVIATAVGPQARRDQTATDKDGVFTFPAIIPTPRVIRIGPGNERVIPARSTFTKEDLARVEEDVETTYWPGGVNDPALALPLKVIPGAVVNIGTIRLRKVPYYRAHLTFSGECGPRETWMVTVDSRMSPTPCAKELMFEKLSPGPHIFAVALGGSQPGLTRWALEEFSIDRGNVEVAVTFHPSVDVPVRIIGSKSATLGTSRIALHSTTSTNPEGNVPRIDTVTSSFTIEKVVWPQHQVYFPMLDPGYAVKEIRYGNLPVTDGIITPVTGATLEIVVDDQPASLSGTAPPGSAVYVVKWPFVPILERPYTYFTRVGDSGKFQFPALTAGEYRALTAPAINLNAASLALVLPAASRITLEKGASKTIELK